MLQKDNWIPVKSSLCQSCHYASHAPVHCFTLHFCLFFVYGVIQCSNPPPCAYLVDHVPNNYYQTLCNVLIGAKCEPSSKTKARLAKLINLTAINQPKVFQEIGRKPKIVIKSNLSVSLDHRMLPFYYQIKDKHH